MMESGECRDKGAFMNVMAEIAKLESILCEKLQEISTGIQHQGRFSRSDAGKWARPSFIRMRA
jgi:hypothetical protein